MAFSWISPGRPAGKYLFFLTPLRARVALPDSLVKPDFLLRSWRLSQPPWADATALRTRASMVLAGSGFFGMILLLCMGLCAAPGDTVGVP